ncbi:MAG: bifunctional tRNA (5-methylaminomethyl-2-thiouridine)(34)-methyltransferase MnmD/FAD-dependent 5-carboxymethylaminomethyl-2-thiouridine(34) oxidoreductase MnmC [Janthinobacterium lividum]
MNPSVARITPAQLAFAADGTPRSREFDDIYHSATGAFSQAAHVFLAGNGLPARWTARRHFVILETGFGLGINFLASWSAWREDAARCTRLHFVSIEKHPPCAADLQRVHAAMSAAPSALSAQLIDAWPLLTPGCHRLEFEGGRVVLTLFFGDALTTLAGLSLRADAFFLDGFAPSRNPEMWQPALCRALAKLADEDAHCATYTAAGDVRRALIGAGFDVKRQPGFGSKREMLAGPFAPRWKIRRHEPPRAVPVATRTAMVIGAGLAGCALAERLAARGWQVSLIDASSAPAQQASGNPAGIFHPLLSRDDNLGARLSRAAFFYLLQVLKSLAGAQPLAFGANHGLLQIAESDAAFEDLRRMLAEFDWPAEFVQSIGVDDAVRLAHCRPARGGLLFPQGGWLEPARLCEHLLARAAACRGLESRFDTTVARLLRVDEQWQALDQAGHEIARAPLVVVANSLDAARLTGLAHLPLEPVRGQLTRLPAALAPGVPIVGDGYLSPCADGAITGASYDIGETDLQPRPQSDIENLARLDALIPGLSVATRLKDMPLGARVGLRCVTPDRLPMIGALPDETAALADPTLRGAHLLDLPRTPGLYGAFGFGSRGLLWATLGAELLASLIEGEPAPVERALTDAVDPARFLLRHLRCSPN